VTEEVELLEDHADPGALAEDIGLAPLPQDVALQPVSHDLAVDGDDPPVEALEMIDGPQQSGLARAAGAQDRGHRPR
jgi:hypothetical protein